MGVPSKDKVEKKVVEAFQEVRRRRRVKEELSHFCTETSFTPLTIIYNAPSITRKIGWTILLLAMMAWLTIQCYWLLDKYFQYPMEVKMDIEAAVELDFPSVTVCNLNPIKNSELERDFESLRHFTDKINDNDMLFDSYNENMDRTPPDYSVTTGTRPPLTRLAIDTSVVTSLTSSLLRSAGSTVTTSPPTSMGSLSPTSSPPPTTTTKASVRKKRSVSDGNSDGNPVLFDDLRPDGYVAGKDKEAWKVLESELFHEDAKRSERHKRNIDREQMDRLVNNTFNKWDALDDENLTGSYYETRGTEYNAAMAYATLTAMLPTSTVKASGYNIENFILTCRFNGWQCSPKNFTYFHNHKYGNCYTFNSHELPGHQSTMFAGPEYGLTLEMYIQQDVYVPALAAEAGVRVLIHPKGIMPFPEDNGISIPPGHSSSVSLRMITIDRLPLPHGKCGDDAVHRDLYAMNLNTSYSKLSCLKSCFQAIFQRHCNCSMPIFYVENNKNVCNMTDNVVDSCTTSVYTSVPEEFTACDTQCPQPCSEVDYHMVVSLAAWPSEKYSSYLQSKVQQCNYLLMQKFRTELNEDDFVKLNVYYKDLLFQKVEQQKSYEMENLLGDIGGQLGLWLGLSAVTIGELCTLALALFRSATSVEPKDDDPGVTHVKPFSTPPELDPNRDVLVSDVKKGGFSV